MFEIGHPPNPNSSANNTITKEDKPSTETAEIKQSKEKDKEKKDESEDGQGGGSKHKIHLPHFRGHKRSRSHGLDQPKNDQIKRDEEDDEAKLAKNRAESTPVLSRRGTTSIKREKKSKLKDKEKGGDVIKREAPPNTNKAKAKSIELTVCYKFEKLWDDSKTGAMPHEISIYRITAPSGYHCLGDYYEQTQSSAQHNQPENLHGFFAVKEASFDGVALLAEPTGYEKMWDDRGIGSKFGPISIWKPIPPPDYVSMGHVVTISQSDAPPSTSIVRCVHKDFVQESVYAPLLVWSDKKTGSKQGGISLWDRQIALNDKEFTPGTFISYAGHNPPKEPLYVFSRASCFAPGTTLFDIDYILLIQEMLDQEDGVKTTKRKTVFKSYKCFTGTEAVDWVEAHHSCKKRKDALAVCEYFFRAGAIIHDTDKTKNFSENASFRFRQHLIHLLQGKKAEDIFDFPLAQKKNLAKSKEKAKKKELKKLSVASADDFIVYNSSSKAGLRELEPEPEPGPGPGEGSQLFGSSLTQILQDEHREDSIPLIVEKCIAFLRLESNIKCLGLFRLNGKHNECELLKKEFSSPTGGANLDLVELNFSPHSVAHVLKFFFRSLPESIFTTELYIEWIAAADQPEESAMVEKIDGVLKKLPPMNFRLLSILFRFLYDVSLHAEDNKMNASNLSRVIGPNFTRDTPDQTKFIYETNATVTLVEKMLVHCNTLFPATPLETKQPAEEATKSETEIKGEDTSKTETATEGCDQKAEEKEKTISSSGDVQVKQPAPATTTTTTTTTTPQPAEAEQKTPNQESQQTVTPTTPTKESQSNPEGFVFNYAESNDLSGEKQSSVLANHKKLFEQKIAESQPKSREEVEAKVRHSRLYSAESLESIKTVDTPVKAPRPSLNSIPPNLQNSALRLVSPGKALQSKKLFEAKIAAEKPVTEEELVAQVKLRSPRKHYEGGESAAGMSASAPTLPTITTTPSTPTSSQPNTPVKQPNNALASKLGFFEQVAIKEAEAAAPTGKPSPRKQSKEGV